MDPNDVLANLRSASEEWTSDHLHLTHQDATDKLTYVLDLFEALDGWISRGGFLPKEWDA